MRRDQRESSYSDLEDIESIKRSIRESSQTKEENVHSYSRGWSDLSSRKDVNEMERRYSRGKSEERYPREYRGRSISPSRDFSHRQPRSASVIPAERAPSYVRALSPIRELFKSSTSESKVDASQGSSEKISQAVSDALKKVEERYPYFIPRYFYPYYRPYYSISSSDFETARALSRARRYLTPRFDYLSRRPYYDYIFNTPMTYAPYVPKASTTPKTFSMQSETHKQSNYNPSMFRSFYTYPNLNYTRTYLPRHYYM